MGVLGSPTRTVAALVTVLVLVSSANAEFNGYDGKPRPSGMDEQPTTTLGAKPAVKYEGKSADCIWYAWENNVNYPPAATSNCSKLLWTDLSENAEPADLQGFLYYFPDPSIFPEFYDSAFKEFLCAIGCFDLSATGGPSTSPPPANPPVAATPVESEPPVMPPPVAPVVPPTLSPATPPETPPPVIATPPASVMVPPPPATLFRPPPPGLPLPPTSLVIPPSGPSQAPGPASQTSAGIALRSFSGSIQFLFVAGVFLAFGLAL